MMAKEGEVEGIISRCAAICVNNMGMTAFMAILSMMSTRRLRRLIILESYKPLLSIHKNNHYWGLLMIIITWLVSWLPPNTTPENNEYNLLIILIAAITMFHLINREECSSKLKVRRLARQGCSA